jgi:CRISPR/Cas system-associated exonuclease Cas4 (RecB family)
VLKTKHNISQPSMPFPSIVSRIGALQKEYYSGKRTEEILPVLPPGIVKHGEKKIRSRVFNFPGSESTCFIEGRFDIVAELDDGSFAVMDFKTGSPSEESSETYGRQLHAYAISLEDPGPEALKLSPVSLLGLIYFTPDECSKPETSRQTLTGHLEWVNIERNDENFMSFAQDLVKLLDGPLPEPQPDTCKWCAYRYKLSKMQTGSVLSISPPKCPTCGGAMQLKSGQYGEFWSCLRYPECKGTRRI